MVILLHFLEDLVKVVAAVVIDIEVADNPQSQRIITWNSLVTNDNYDNKSVAEFVSLSRVTEKKG